MPNVNVLTSLDHLLTVLLPFVAVVLVVLFTVLNVVKHRRERERREDAVWAQISQDRAHQKRILVNFDDL